MAINLGNIVAVNGRPLGNGISSGLDVESIVEGLTTAKRTPAVALEEKIEINDSKLTAYSELRNLLENLKTAVDFLRNPPGFNNSEDNIFDYRTVSLASSTSTAASTYLSATADPGAALGNFSLAVGNLAEARVQRTGSFSSQSDSLVDAAGTNAAGRFSAGTFEFAPTIATEVTTTTDTADTLTAGDYSVVGAVGVTALATGISNIQVADDGDVAFMGTISGISGNFISAPTSTLELSFTINGVDFTSNTIAVNGGAGTDSIAAGTTITFTDENSDVSFDIVTGGEYLIDDDVDNINQFIADIEADLATQSVYQDRQFSHFIDDDVKSPLTGLDSSHVIWVTDEYAANGIYGDFSGFTITRNGADDTTISVEIDGETYEATGLLDSQSANITLDSTTTSKSVQLNINDAGVVLDFSSQSTADDVTASLDYAFGTRALTDITINEDDNLANIAAAINARTSSSGVSAHIIQVSSTDYRLSIQATEVGLDNSYTIVDDDGVLFASVGDGSDGISLSEIQAAEDSVIAVDDIVLTRSTNVITDVVTGLNLTLVAETDSFADQTAYDALVSPTLITSTVANDKDTAEAGIINFINAFNEFRVFAAEQTAISEDGEVSEDAVLERDTLLTTLIGQIAAEINTAVAGVSDSDYTSLSSIGIVVSDFAGDDDTPETTNILTYDPTELTNNLDSVYNQVREIFEFSFNANSADLSVFESSNDINLTDFHLDIDTSRTGDEVRVYDVEGGTLLFNMDISASGTTITGQDDTDLEGMILIYSGDGTDTINVNMSQGVGDRIFNLLDPILEDDGSLDDAVELVTDNTDDLNEEIDRIDAQIDTYRDTLLAKFSAMEEAITRVNTLLDFLEQNNQSIFGTSG